MAFAERETSNADLERIRSDLPSLAAALPPGLQHLAPGTPLATVLAVLHRDGACVLTRAVSDECADGVVAEMAPYLDAIAAGDTFTGVNTKRAGAVVARSPSSWEIVGHPMLLQVCEAVIGRQLLNMTEAELAETSHRGTPGPRGKPTTKFTHPFQCHLHQIISIGPDSPAQAIHRDEGAFVFNFGGALEVEVSTIWALNDFTPEIGPTRVVTGSHRWPLSRVPDLKDSSSDWAQAVMPKGSCVIYLGSTLHSGGENRSKDMTRWGLNVDYSIGWLRQEVNQYLDVPPKVARTLPANIQSLIGEKRAAPIPPITTLELIPPTDASSHSRILYLPDAAGYSMAGPALGYFDNGTEFASYPTEAFRSAVDERDVNWATKNMIGFTPWGPEAEAVKKQLQLQAVAKDNEEKKRKRKEKEGQRAKL